MKGIFLLNKPSGISSAQFLNRFKTIVHNHICSHESKEACRKAKRIRIGHGGTLDPFASGLLVVAVGREYTTKLSELLKNTPKTYQARIVLGAISDTYDREGKLEQRGLCRIQQNKKGEAPVVSKEDIKKAITIVAQRETQVPPPYSAIKIQGKPAYARARAGEQLTMKPRPATVYSYKIECVNIGEREAVAEVALSVSSGFYIRSFAHDMGELLGVGAYLDGLVRKKIGEYVLEYAHTLKEIEKKYPAISRDGEEKRP